jgi:galactitol-specific phosphotransferase system IIC component
MDIMKNLADLLKVKTIVTLTVMIVFAVLALRGDIQPDVVMNVVLMVIAFYFGTQHEKKSAATSNETGVKSEVTAE